MDSYSQSAPVPTTEEQPPDTTWSRLKKFLGPVAAVGIVIAKFFAKVEFLILPLLKFLPVILK